ncbi:RNA 2',3'-cyclic phosphodiesterase [Paenibacillus sp. IB182496]|uniref:RNA 2',3'-cyclic phosphodiesterase n=1 Tax=Paenibacillus sabuli TaxID=2772509 RepID=A0A927GT25_9BACL|nr:RNA 2',3'-cyclic phosphodiesterase [Paenibacillus sabuli]MBD2846645.1 RNA 2',3'-cyclic phosphodiesterase [Paenibacillus sabuli]
MKHEERKERMNRMNVQDREEHVDRIRYFIGLAPDAAARARLAEAAAARQRDWRFAKWTHPQDFHITLAFLGDLPLPRAAAVRETLDGYVCATAAFEVRVTGWGTFGPPQRPAILWAGVAASEGLGALHGELWQALAPLGFEPETRPFRPHLTAARRSQGTTAADVAAMQEEQEAREALGVEWEAREAVLLQTHFGRRPAYAPVLGLPLRPRV